MGLEEIISLARSNGVETIAITDHDCLAGTVRAKIIGERYNVKVIPGVELSAYDEETGHFAHILCYLPDYPDRLEGLCKKNNDARTKASQMMKIRTAKKFPASAELMRRCAAGSTSLYKQHVMQALMECGLATELYGELHDRLFSPDSEDCVVIKPAFASVETVLETIHSAGGIAVLAHPALYDNFSLLEKYAGCGFDGVEVWHPSADEATCERLIAIAKKHKMLMTGGSDFHGLYNKSPVTVGSYLTPKTQLNELTGFKAKQKRLQKKLAAAEEKKAGADAE